LEKLQKHLVSIFSVQRSNKIDQFETLIQRKNYINAESDILKHLTSYNSHFNSS